MRDDAAHPVSDLEQEGIPDMDDPYPGEAATGARWDETMAPGDEPIGVDEFGVTAAEELSDEPLAERVQREVPDIVGLEDDDPVARLVDPDGGGITDGEGDVVASEALGDAGALSAEEAAMHLTSEDDAPGLSWDDSPGYIDVEERS